MSNEEVGFRLKRTRLNYRFHNPNSAEDTAEYLYKIMVEVNSGKVERAIKNAAIADVVENEYIEQSEENVNTKCREAKARYA